MADVLILAGVASAAAVACVVLRDQLKLTVALRRWPDENDVALYRYDRRLSEPRPAEAPQPRRALSSTGLLAVLVAGFLLTPRGRRGRG
jgi:hypothetical protein